MTIDQPITTGESDDVLMRLIAEFGANNRARHEVREILNRHRDCTSAPPDDHHTVLQPEWQRLLNAIAAIGNEIFNTPAHTLQGAVEKLKIVRLQRGDYDCKIDVELDCCMESDDESWFASVMKDFERLIAAPPESRVAAE